MKKTVLVVIMAGLVSVALAFRHTHRSENKMIASGFSEVMTIVENGRLIANVRRQVKSNGEFIEETDHLSPDGSIAKHTKLAGSATYGAVVIDDTNKSLISEGRAALVSTVAESDLKRSATYSRDDSLLGYRVVVQRNCDAANRCTEYWTAPELGSDYLKVDLIDGDYRLTKQAVSVTRSEPVFDIPNYPIRSASTRADTAKR